MLRRLTCRWPSMTSRQLLRRVAQVSMVASAIGLARADSVRTIPLRYADARAVAAYVSGLCPDAEEVLEITARRFVTDTIEKAIRRADGQTGRWHSTASASPAPGATRLPLAWALDGLVQPLVPLPAENALLARGTPEAIDALLEVVRLLDRPGPMVTVQVRLLEDMALAETDWLAAPDLDSGELAVSHERPLPPSSRHFRWGVLRAQAVAAIEEGRGFSRATTGASVTSLSGAPGLLSVGHAVPVFRTQIGYDDAGNRVTETTPSALFIGLELLVVPRVTAGDDVVMRLRPTLTSWAGQVMGPGEALYPVTRRALAETEVRVRCGESLAFAGWEEAASDWFTSDCLGVDYRQAGTRAVMLVTPSIIWAETPERDPFG